MKNYKSELNIVELEILEKFLQRAITDKIITTPEGIENTENIIKKLQAQKEEIKKEATKILKNF